MPHLEVKITCCLAVSSISRPSRLIWSSLWCFFFFFFKLVSAMKGSREKQGGSPRKLTVSWAPDVYDPIPNSLSHSVKSKQKKSSRKDRDKDNNHNKKNGKKGQKGSSSKGLGGKDKKQFRKSGGRSDKCYKTMDAPEDTDFGVGSPDYCGSSFLKNSGAKFHYSVAEAL